MSITIFQQLGLSPNEAKIYDALLELKEAGVGAIASQTKIHRRSIYDAIKRLIDKGLVFPILTRGDSTYAPVDPDKLLEFIKEKELALNRVLPDLRARFEERRGSQEAYIYRGINGFKNYMRDVLRVGQDAYFIGAKLGWFDPRLAAFTGQFFKEVSRKQLRFHHVFDFEVKEKANDTEVKAILESLTEPYRFLPKKYGTASAIDIFGDYVVTFTGLRFQKIDEDVTLFVLHDQSLAQSYKVWFQFIFDRCDEA